MDQVPYQGEGRTTGSSVRATNEAFRCILETTSSGFWHADGEGRLRGVNPSYVRMSGYSEAELLNMCIWDLDALETPQTTAEHLRLLKKTGFDHFTSRHRRKDGSLWDVEVSASYLVSDGGQVFAFFRDVTERNLAAEELARQLDFSQRIFDSTVAHLAVVDRDGIILSVNASWRRFAWANLGGDESAWGVGAQYFRPCCAQDGDLTGAQEAYDGVRKVQRGELSQFSMEYPCHGPGDQKRWFILQAIPLRGDEGSVLVSHQNITERKLAEEALQINERILAISQHLAGVGGWEWDLVEGTMHWTEETYRIHELDPDSLDRGSASLISNSLECYRPQDRPVIEAAFRRCGEEGVGYDLEFPFTTFLGRRRWVRTTTQPLREEGRVVKVVGTLMDITERKVHEEEILKLEKLESLGVLAGGIAHDFNNILTGVLGNISLVSRTLEAGHPAEGPLAEAEKATARAGDLAHQLLTFARGGDPVKKQVSVQALLRETVSLSLRGSNVKGILAADDAVHAVDADEGQLSQVFNNIIINAKQAMPDGGELRVAAGNLCLAADNGQGLPPGHYVEIVLADQGMGIADEDLNRIFDPYFTTKQSGNGLGLASVHSIVHRHGGRVTVESALGYGTAFTLLLPSLGHVYQPQPEAGSLPEVSPWAGAGTVLVMDDEEVIRDLVAALLGQLGHTAVTCADGEAAVGLYREALAAGNPFLAVIMDLTVPGGMGGQEAARQILILDPDACLVVSTGYSNDPVVADHRAFGFQGAITKPFTVARFECVLGALLAGRIPPHVS